MKQSNSKTKQNNQQQQIEWRRNKVFELSVKGFSQVDISRMLEIHKVTISRDISFLREQSRKNIKEHISDKLPLEYNKCILGLEEIIKESWIIIAHSEKIGNTKDKISSLALIKDTYNTKMDLLTNASLLQDSIRFVEENKKDKPMLAHSCANTKKGDLNNGLEGSSEDYITESEQFNQVF